MFAVNLNKTTMPIFYGKVALIESLNLLRPQILLLVSYHGVLHQGHLSLMQHWLRITVP
jgi:pantoate--beta-alanine ligase